MSMHIISPGMLTTVQDLGRRGYMASGFQQGGAMDQFAARAANILLDNSESDGVLEMTLLGVKAYFDEDNVIAITGAEFAPTVTDSETGEVTEIPMNRAVRVKKGDVLDCGSARSGLRGYLAVAGGFDIAPVMGSMSTNLKCKVGGFEGRKLKSGDVLPLRYPQSDLYGMTSRVFEHEKQKDGTVTVHVIPGPGGFLLFLHLHLVNVADFALDGFDGLGLIDGLNVHGNGHFSVHLQQLGKELVGEFGGHNLHIGGRSPSGAHAKQPGLAEVKAGGGNKILRPHSGLGYHIPCKAEGLCAAGVKLTVKYL